MNFNQDWLMRQIESIMGFIASVLFHKTTIHYEITDETQLTQTDLLYTDLQKLVAQRKLCKAEDLLYETIDFQNEKEIELALDFYQTLNLFSDEELESYNFSRAEINEGIKTVLKHIGAENLMI